MSLQLYLHFPFCKTKCLYCDFCSAPGTLDEISAYCRALEKEILIEGEKWGGEKVSTVFLGGGTPSVIPPQSMEGVLRTLTHAFSLQKDAEFTAEANPGTLNEEWLRCACAYGLNRLSLGVQAAQDHLLHSLGRIHTFAEAAAAVQMAKKAGVHNLNADLMFALPGQTLADYRESIERVCGLGVRHVSAYSLIVEEGTPLHRQVEAGRIVPPDDDRAADFYQLGLDTLDGLGYHQYEISNFARDGFECRHNVGYWQGEWYLGLGVSAHSMLPTYGTLEHQDTMHIRRANTSDVNGYCRALLGGGLPARELERISKEEAMFEAVMLGLRMNRGVDGQAFHKRFGLSLPEAYGSALRSLVDDGLGQWLLPHAFALTPKGLLVQNEALLRFMNNY